MTARSKVKTAALAAIAAALIYVPLLGVPLMWDDRPFLINVPAFDHKLPASFYVSPDYFRQSGELTWRPLSTFSYATLVRTFGRNPLPLRVTSLLLHLSACALLGFLVASFGFSLEIALAAAALFAIHPAHIETLLTVTFNKEILSTIGILGLLLAHRRRHVTLAAASFIAGCLAKESGIVGIVLVVMMEFLEGGVPALRRRGRDLGIYAAVAVCYLVVRFGPLKGPGGEANLSALLPWAERAYYAAQGFVSSARVMLAPWGLRIEYFALPPASIWKAGLWLAAASALLIALVESARRKSRSEPALAFFLLWPLPALFLVSNLLPTGVLSLRLLAERWLYLPAAGVCAAVAIFLRGKPARLRLLMAFWVVLGLARVQDWRDETHLWSSLVQIYPWSAKAIEGRGEALYRSGRIREALLQFERAELTRDNRNDLVLRHYVPLAPPGTIAWDSAPLQRWLGRSRLRLGDERGALFAFEKANALQPSDGYTYRVLAYEYVRLNDFSTGRSWLEKGLAVDPHDEFLVRLKGDIARRRLSFYARFD